MAQQNETPCIIENIFRFAINKKFLYIYRGTSRILVYKHSTALKVYSKCKYLKSENF